MKAYYQVVNADLVRPNWASRRRKGVDANGCLGVIVSTHYTLANALKAQAKYRRGALYGDPLDFQIYRTKWFRPYCSSYLDESYGGGKYQPCKINLWEL